MNPLWTVLLVMAAFLAVLHLKNRGRRRARLEPTYSRRIEGYQVVAFLQPEISGACLFDHGLQFGRGFRRKEGPELPHGPHCRCATAPFSFTSSEVFHGSLRDVAEYPGSLANLPKGEAKRLFETLKKMEGVPLPTDETAYLGLAEPDAFPEKYRPEVETFLRQRFRFLKTAAPEAAAPASAAAPKPAEAAER